MEIKHRQYTPNFQALIIKKAPKELEKALMANKELEKFSLDYNVITKCFRNKSSVIPEDYTKIGIPSDYKGEYYLYGVTFDIKKPSGLRAGKQGYYYAGAQNNDIEQTSIKYLKKVIDNINIKKLNAWLKNFQVENNLVKNS